MKIWHKRLYRSGNIFEESYLNYGRILLPSPSFFRLRCFGESRADGEFHYRINLHNFDYINIEIITGGKSRFHSDGENSIMGRGNVICTGHYFEMSSVAPAESFQKTYLLIEYSQMLKRLFEFSQDGNLFFFLSDMTRLESLLAEMKSLVTGTDPESMEKVSVLIYAVILEICRSRKQPDVIDEFTQIRQSLDIAPEDFPDIASMREKFHVSRYALTKYFREYEHTTPMEYVIGKRLCKAAWFLENQNIPVAEIAAMCGFRYVSFFNRAFKKRFGMTPLAYRKQKQ